MTVVRSNHMTFEIPLIILAPDHHGGLLVPLVSNPFALAVPININELTEFISLLLSIDQKVLLP